MAGLFVGVDVGTASARAGVFDAEGALLGSARQPIRLWHGEGTVVEQSSQDIWEAVARAVRAALAAAGATGDDVRGLGFDATCSLVVVEADGTPLPVGTSQDPARNVIVWMDHRAVAQSDRITAGGHEVLRYVGGAISPEMETPKLLWLKENRPEIFARAGHFFDLADYLSWRATGSAARSVCTTTCKWTYLAHEGRWDPDYFRSVGLEAFVEEGFKRIGVDVVDIATPLADGLTVRSAEALGLRAGTPVGASLIDAHAGALGTLGARRADGRAGDPLSELSLIMGTSACVMALTRDPVFVPGVWGPYNRALLPGTWLLEGGQSAYGAALDHLIALHPAFAELQSVAAGEGVPILDCLEGRAVRLAGSLAQAARLARDIHVVPHFLGNRSPQADPHATAVLSGLRLETSLDSLARLFVAGLCGLCYGTRAIVEANRAQGIDLDTIVVSGGASRSPLLRRILADATGLKVALPMTREPVLLGSAMLGAVASGTYADLTSAAFHMCRTGEEIAPDPALAKFHQMKSNAYAILFEAERRVRALNAVD